jgi:hypothetical protein
MRRCTKMQMRWSPSGPKLRSSPAGFRLCWNIWASQPPLGTGSRKSHVQGGWSSKPLQRSSSDLESSADTRDQLSVPLTGTLLLTPPGKPSHGGSIATRVGCRTPSTTSCPTGRMIDSRPMGCRRISPRWRWCTTRLHSERSSLYAPSRGTPMPPSEGTRGW